MPLFSVRPGRFELDGKPFRILAGAIHYFRVPREYWSDRLIKLKACGFNTVETYVAWNAHMPDENSFITDGMLDIGAFLDTAAELGLYAIVRPGPYICSEWEFGGLPWWLLKEDMSLRCMDKAFIRRVDEYLDRLLPILVPRQLSCGGNILMMQVENEYGSYGDDRDYLKYLRDAYQKRGISIPLFTSDGDCDWMLTGGMLPGTLATVNFGSDPEKRFEALDRFQSTGPKMCSEYWNGWFDHWGENHHARDPKDSAEHFARLLRTGASVSVYMFHGGTNFGFMNGANCPAPRNYQPTVNSYDDDALLNECGDITPKYSLFQKALKPYAAANDTPLPAPIPRKAYGKVELNEWADLIDSAPLLGKAHTMAAPRPMEKLDQGYGFILYSAFVRGPREENTLHIQDLHDRAHVFTDGRFVGTMYRNDEKSDIRIRVPEEGLYLSILVENLGRVNYGPYLSDPKGITQGVRLGQQFLYGWEVFTLPMDDLSKLRFQSGPKSFDGRPVLLRGTFDAGDNPCDCFVSLPGFRKGVIFINGKPLSRHWHIGPQRTAYLPAPFMRQGLNELTVLELDGFEKAEAVLTDEMDIG
ncbi:MAG: beta-galactosidase [Clostridia bacterium]|nr:beta-galactosidase [Clostridia bacterium]